VNLSGKEEKHTRRLAKPPDFGYNLRLDLLNGGCLTGGIAQLGERLHGMQEVSSSILLISTNNPPQNLVAETRRTSPHRLEA
jgi:hypothetical protein